MISSSLLIAACLFSSQGQDADPLALASLEDVHPLEPADITSPRAALTSFIDACYDAHLMIQGGRVRGASATSATRKIRRQLAGCLDLREVPEYLRAYKVGETAACLKEVIDRIELPPLEQIPGVEDIAAAGEEGIPFYRIPHTSIVLLRVEGGPRHGHYLFSSNTVDQAVDFYESVKHVPYREGPYVTPGIYEWFLSEPGSAWLGAVVHRLPAWTKKRVYGQALWQWTGLFLTAILGLTAMIAAYAFGRIRARLTRKKGIFRHLFTLLFPVAALLVPLLARDFISEDLVISGPTLAFARFGANLVFLIAVVVLVMGTGNRVVDVILNTPRFHPRGIDAQVVRLVARVITLAVVVILFLEGGRYLGIPLSTLLAGAGVGGLAIALAAQDALRNVFGTLMIFLDRPYRVGERVVVKDYDGVVEEIGLRSTKIRLLTGNIATIPNEEMARSEIENVGRRPHIRRLADLRIPLDTPTEKVERAVEIVREILADRRELIASHPPRVFLKEFEEDALEIRFMYWFAPPDYWEFMAFGEEVNLEIKRAFEAAGIEFALPSSKTILVRAGES